MTSTIIHPEFYGHIQHNVYYEFYYCLNDLRRKLNALDPLIKDKKQAEARFLLHQMIGTSKIICEQVLSDSVEKIHELITLGNWSDQLTEQLGVFTNQMENLYKQLDQEVAKIDVLVYNDLKRLMSSVLKRFKGLEFVSNVTYVKVKSEIYYEVQNQRIDLIIFLTDNKRGIKSHVKNLIEKESGTTLMHFKEQEFFSQKQEDFVRLLKETKLSRMHRIDI